MARVRPYEQRTSAQSGGPLGLVNPNSQPDPMRGTLRQLGSDVQQAGQVIERRRADEAMAAANARMAQSTREVQGELDALLSSPASDFPEAEKKFRSSLSQRRFDDRKAAGSQQARDFLDVEHERLLASMEQRIAGQRGQAIAERFGASLDEALAADSATIERDPTQADTVLERTRVAIEHSGLDQVTQARVTARAEGILARATVRGVRARDPRRAIEQLEKPEPDIPAFRMLSPQERQAELQAARTEERQQTIGGLVDGAMSAFGRSMSAGDAALAKLDSLTGIADDEKAEVHRLVRARLGVLQDERSRQYGPEVTQIVLRVKAGAATERDIARLGTLRELGAVSDAQREAYLSMHQDAARRSQEAQAGADEVAAVLRAGLPLDPTSSDHRKALAGAFQSAIGTMPVSDERALATGLGYAKQTRMLPPQLSSWLNSASRSPDMATATRAAEYGLAVRRNAPEAWGELNSDTRSFLATVGDMLSAGAPRERAFETARQLTYDAPPALLEQRKAQLPAVERALPTVLGRFIDRDFDPGLFRSEPAPTQRLEADFARQVRAYYLKTGNPDTAQELAWEDLRRVYGRTEVNGTPELQPFPIEAAGLKREDARAAIEKLLAASPHEGVTADRVRVVSDDLTLAQVSNALDGKPVRPSYALVTDQGDVLLNADGTRARLALPSVDALRAHLEAQRDAANAEELAKARRDRKDTQVMQQYLYDRMTGAAP